jgi:hypothetical protein
MAAAGAALVVVWPTDGAEAAAGAGGAAALAVVWVTDDDCTAGEGADAAAPEADCLVVTGALTGGVAFCAPAYMHEHNRTQGWGKDWCADVFKQRTNWVHHKHSRGDGEEVKLMQQQFKDSSCNMQAAAHLYL